MFSGCARQSAQSVDELLTLGERFLLELDYEQALVQFLKVIEIDPMRPRGYTGAADAYVGLGRIGDAIAILEQGLAHIGSGGSIQMMLGELRGENTGVSPNGGVETPTPPGKITEADFVWAVEPSLQYDEVYYVPTWGFIAYTATNDVHTWYDIDERTGQIIREHEPFGGFGIPYTFGYDEESEVFYNNEEYMYYPTSADTVASESYDTVVCIYQFQEDEYGMNRILDSKSAIYYNGEFVTDFIYEWVIGGNSIAFVMQHGKYAVADNKGNLLTGFDFDSVSLIATGFIAAQVGDRWGFLDLYGNEIIPFIFEDAENVDTVTAFVKLHGLYGILDVDWTVWPS